MNLTDELAKPTTQRSMAAVIGKHLGRHEVDDVMHDVYVKVLSRAHDGTTVEDPTAYCITVAGHLAEDRLRQRELESNLRTQLSHLSDSRPHEPSPEGLIANRQQLDRTLQSLSRETLQALELIAEGLTHKEVARYLGISPHAVGRHVRRAYQRAGASAQHLHAMTSRPRLPPSKFSGTLYELDRNLELPPKQIIAQVQPQLRIASAALAERLKACPDDVYDRTPRQFELLVAELFEDMSTGPVEITPFTRDGGRDLLAYVNLRFSRILCLIEAKKYRRDRPVGIELVRALYGVVCHHDASQGIVVTTSTFTQDARHFESQHEHRLSLSDYRNVADWIRQYRTPSRGRTACR